MDGFGHDGIPDPGHVDPADPVAMDVDLGALAHNLGAVRELVGPGVGVMASIKGNGYGCGAAPVANALRRAGVLAVATGGIRDALAIRGSGNDVPIHMFPGILPGALGTLFAHGLMPTLYDEDIADEASRVATSTWKVFVKVDAGFGRLGVRLEEAERFILAVARRPRLEVEGVFTHLPFAGDDALPWVEERLRRFDDMLEGLAAKGLEVPIRQSLASAHVIKGLRSACDTVCVGHLLFGGLGRFEADDGNAARFRPVHRAIRTHVVDLRRYDGATMAGSGGKLAVAAGAVLGTVPLGLHEGYRAGAHGRVASMLVRGAAAPVLSVTQEYSVIDLTGAPGARVGDEALAVGEDGDRSVSFLEMAAAQGRSPLEAAMTMDGGMPKRYRH